MPPPPSPTGSTAVRMPESFFSSLSNSSQSHAADSDDAVPGLVLDRHEVVRPFSTHIKLMLTHELRLKRRKPIASLCELLTPTLCVVLLLMASTINDTQELPQRRDDTLRAGEVHLLNITEFHARLQSTLCVRMTAGKAGDVNAYLRQHKVPIDFGVCPDGALMCRGAEASDRVPTGVSLCIKPGSEKDVLATFFKAEAFTGGGDDLEGAQQDMINFMKNYQLDYPAALMDIDDYYRLQWAGNLFVDLSPPGENKMELVHRLDWLLSIGSIELALGDAVNASTHCPLLQAMIDHLSTRYVTFNWTYDKTFDRGSLCEGVWDDAGAAVHHAATATHAGYEGKRAWALVVLEPSDVANKQLDVVLRMNITRSSCRSSSRLGYPAVSDVEGGPMPPATASPPAPRLVRLMRTSALNTGG